MVPETGPEELLRRPQGVMRRPNGPLRGPRGILGIKNQTQEFQVART